ncbi:MAG TPA: type II methionyl aminopeptidase [Candidatus Thermoplasmatota archaeon]|nr:type II methionyl aminopeptidase [Candidatus Thermoplasmatota archaeon]
MDAAAQEKYRKAGEVAGRAREYGATLVKPGVKLVDVAEAVEKFIRDHGAQPAFPCCISVDADAAHDTPAPLDERVFAEGQVVKLDCGAQVDGWIGDTAITVEVGATPHGRLLQAARDALAAAVETVKPGVQVRDVSAAVEAAIRGHGFQPVANLTGHSVDRYHQHAGVSIPSVAATARGQLLPGMAVAIEPFATDGQGKVRDAGGGHVWHFQAPRPQRDPTARAALDYIARHHPDLPFAERWIANAVPAAKVAYAMKLLERSGAVKQYPVLREAGGGQVAQFEHTFLILEDGVVVTTRV